MIRIGEAIRADPMPLALIGLGALWMFATNTGIVDRIARNGRIQAARGRVLGRAGESAIDGAETDRSAGWVHRAAGTVRSAARSISETSGAVVERTGEYAGYAGDRARRAGWRIAENVQADPMLLGGLAVVAGAAIAALLPPTRIEHEWADETREALWDKAAALGHEAAERIRRLSDGSAHVVLGSMPRD